jgi:S1-C subfamily serine protease
MLVPYALRAPAPVNLGVRNHQPLPRVISTVKKLLYAVGFLGALLMSGCSTTYNSLSQRTDGSSDLIVTTESEILSASFEAITRTFPSANIQTLGAPLKGYAWFHMPMLDRTDFRFMLSKRSGEIPDGTSITGWSYNIVTHGTQGLVEARYVQPLASALNEILKERNISAVAVKKASYVGISDERPNNASSKSAASGTGFFVSEDGYIVSNHHVISDATEVEVYDSTGQKFSAKVISSDISNDVALLKIESKSTPLAISQTANVKKGNEIFTLGYPVVGIQGQEQKATFGRVNALSGVQGDIRYFQIDVPIQPGNSGGPLISEDGSVIAIVTASLNQINTLKATGALPQNVNYAVKSEYFIPLLQFAKVAPISVKPIFSAIKDPSQFEKSVVHIIARSK